MNNNIFKHHYIAMIPSVSYSLKKFVSRILVAGIAISALTTSSSVLAQNSGFAGDWKGIITVRPPGQDEIKKYNLILKLGSLTKVNHSFDEYYYQILSAKIALEKNTNFVNIDLTSLPYKGRLTATRGPNRVFYSSIRLIESARNRKDGGKLSKAFPDCMDKLELGKLNINSSEDLIEGEVECDNNPLVYSGNIGTMTLKRVGSAITSPGASNLPEYKIPDIFLPN